MLYNQYKQIKKIIFIGNSRRRIKEFPEVACDVARYQLWLVQQGKEPDDWKPMPSIGKGVREIRIHQPYEHRVIYIAHFLEAIYVLHAFDKKRNDTAKTDKAIARRAYAEIQTKRKIKEERPS
jgi:phage-related protein